MTANARRRLAALVLVAGLYLNLPVLWPEPRVEGRWSEMPGEDPEAIIRVRSWHSNVRIARVAFCVELSEPNPQGQTFICPEPLFDDGGGTRRIPVLKLSRLTYPRTTEMRVPLPLRKLVQEGSVPAGSIRGWLETTVVYADLLWPRFLPLAPYVEDLTTSRSSFVFLVEG